MKLRHLINFFAFCLILSVSEVRVQSSAILSYQDFMTIVLANHPIAKAADLLEMRSNSVSVGSSFNRSRRASSRRCCQARSSMIWRLYGRIMAFMIPREMPAVVKNPMGTSMMALSWVGESCRADTGWAFDTNL